MGNILCRDKTPRRVYVRGPIKGTNNTVFDPQLFSNDSLVNGTRKDAQNPNKHTPNNQKMFFSTPNLNNDMKSTISLDARIFDSDKSQNPPIAPPRKKRTTLKKGSTLPTNLPSDNVRNGFKDVFGNASISPRNTDDIDYIDTEENTLQERSTSADVRTSTPEKKLRVGNKKTDKFFGEDLSDHLSDEKISPIKSSELEEAADDSKPISDKKLSFFLMNMLDDIRNAEDEDKYKDQVPVDEPPFIARKKETKHICDDDDHIHIYVHKSETESSDQAPPKPDRDFTKFKASTPEKDDIESPNTSKRIEAIQTKVIIRRGISRDALPSPPDTPYRKKGVTSLPTTPTITINTIDASIDKTTAENESKKAKNEKSQEPIDPNITKLMDQVIKNAYGIGDFNYNPEDHAHHTHDDGSNLVTPTSKLAVRKISTTRKISTESQPSIDSETSSIKANDLSLPSTPYKKSSFCENEVKLNQMLEDDKSKFSEISQVTTIPSPSMPNRECSPSEKLFSGSSVNDIIDEIYNKNSDIMKEFQTFLEQSIEKEPVISAEDEKKFLDARKSLEITDPVKPRHDDDDDFDDRSYSDSFESSDNEQEIDEINSKPQQQPRRESIEDVDNWFSHHIEMEQKESEVCNSHNNEHRPSVNYDTNKIFPFGSTITGRRESQSDEFFSSDVSSIIQRVKPQIEALQETENSISEENDEKKDREKRVWSKESSPDHSTLLKYLDKNDDGTETNTSNNQA